MKNKFIIDGDITTIFIYSFGDYIPCLIDTQDLEKVSSIKGTWFFDRGYASYKATNVPKIRMHRLIKETPLELFVDHINHNKLDNRRVNLRNVTKQINAINRSGAQINNKSSGIRGVTWHKQYKKWVAQARFNQSIVRIGFYDNKEDANEAVHNFWLEKTGIKIK